MIGKLSKVANTAEIGTKIIDTKPVTTRISFINI